MEEIEVSTPAAVVSPKRILLLGASGMLGSDVLRAIENSIHSVYAPTHKEIDVARPDDLEHIRRFDEGKFDWIINCIAYTGVDQAESEMMAANRLNGVAPGLIAYVAKSMGARFIHISSDFVFDGGARSPYREDAPTKPVNAYGRTKLFGEQNAIKENPDTIIVRTSWLYGPNGKSFPRTMIEAWLAGKELKVVDDQIGTPTYAADLAQVLMGLIDADAAAGVYHAAGPDIMTWHEFALRAITAYRDLILKSNQAIDVAPVPSSAWPTPAKRPAYSALGCTKLEGLALAPLPSTDISLAAFVSRLKLG